MKDLEGYLSRMEKAMVEKLYFLQHINFEEYDYVIDFGCANGALLKSIIPLSSNTQFIGIDSNAELIFIAQSKLKEENFVFFESLKATLKEIELGKKVAIILSSVLHELPKKVIRQIITLAKNLDTIIIRDMFFDSNYNEKIYGALSIFENSRLIEDYQIKDFTKYHGKISSTKSLYHFLLKYTYTDNWETEVKENYFSVPWKKLNKKLIKNNFEIVYSKEYILNFKHNEVLKNFGYELKYPTHKNIIYKKK